MGLKEGLRRTRARFGAGLARLVGTAGGEGAVEEIEDLLLGACLLYTSPSPRD